MNTLVPAPPLPGLQLTAVGYRPINADLFDTEAMTAAAAALRRVDDLAGFAVGDLYLAIAAAAGPAKANEVLTGQGHNQARLGVAVAVAAAIPHDLRRPALSWSHHVEVRRLDHQGIDRWLRTAETEGLSVHALRARIADAAPTAGPRTPTPRPPGRRLREALEQSPVVAWVPSVGQLGPVSVRHVAEERTPAGRMLVLVEADPALAGVLAGHTPGGTGA